MSGRIYVEVRCDAMPDGPEGPPCMTPAAIDGITTLTARRRSSQWTGSMKS